MTARKGIDIKGSADPIPVALRVNGSAYSVRVQPRQLLSDVLREDLGLTGTHVACEHGVCGSCTVLLGGEPIRSCLMLAVQARGVEITTIEGLGSPDALSVLQESMRDAHAFQCGFCTPGILLTLHAFLHEEGIPTEDDVKSRLSGNLCRCTGYQSIVQGAMLAIERMNAASVGSPDAGPASKEVTP